MTKLPRFAFQQAQRLLRGMRNRSSRRVTAKYQISPLVAPDDSPTPIVTKTIRAQIDTAARKGFVADALPRKLLEELIDERAERRRLLAAAVNALDDVMAQLAALFPLPLPPAPTSEPEKPRRRKSYPLISSLPGGHPARLTHLNGAASSQ